MDIVRAITFNSSTQMGGALWFIIVLFFLTLFYAFIDKAGKRICSICDHSSDNDRGCNSKKRIKETLDIADIRQEHIEDYDETQG